jgi:hypothetical protein
MPTYADCDDAPASGSARHETPCAGIRQAQGSTHAASGRLTLPASSGCAAHGQALPEQAWPEIDGPGPVALASRNPESQTVTLVLDATTASIAIFAIVAHAKPTSAKSNASARARPIRFLRPPQSPPARRG